MALSRGQTAAGVLAAVFAAAAVAVPPLVHDEGWVTRTYPDPVAIPTACAGVTGAGVKAGATYSDAECQQMTGEAVLRIGLAVARCLPDRLPTQTRAAFTRAAYNLGPGAFCASRMAREARAGNLPAACAALSLYVYAGKRKLPGLVARRASERAQCEAGLREGAAP
jgi:lysozyme